MHDGQTAQVIKVWSLLEDAPKWSKALINEENYPVALKKGGQGGQMPPKRGIAQLLFRNCDIAADRALKK